MSHHAASAQPVSVSPLRRLRKDGSLYARPTEIESALAVLVTLPLSEVVARARIVDDKAPDYLPSECVLHFVRKLTNPADKDALRELFTVLRQRLLRAVPVSARHTSKTAKDGMGLVALEIRDAVMDRITDLLCEDRNSHAKTLDCFECRFNFTVARLRSTARRDVPKKASRLEPLHADAESGEPSAEVEAAFARMRNAFDDDEPDFLYRSKLALAITSLPADERRVVELLLKGFLIDSKDETIITIRKILRCGEQTVRNRRDRAYAKLREALKEEEIP